MARWHLPVAIAVHAAAFFAVSRLPIRAPEGTVAPPSEPLIEITSLEPAADEPRSPAASNDAPNDAPTSGPRAHAPAPAVSEPRALGVIVPRGESATAEPLSPRADAPPAAAVPAAPSTGVVPLTARELGIASGGNPFLPKSERAVALAESKRAVDRALKDPAREREAELGLGPEGPVLAALGEATSRSTAPVRGRAVFVATADENGVFAIELRDAEGSRAGWDDARAIALGVLKGKKLRLPAGATRAVMRLEVRSDWKLPSGLDPGTNVSVLRIPVGKGETKDATRVTILDPIPTVRMTEIPLPGGAKIPVPSVELDLFSTNADPANLGAKPRRVVHARVIETQVM
jgi:hypothetical protein